jgi:diguanylate cyclase (GGDEF)-like protein
VVLAAKNPAPSVASMRSVSSLNSGWNESAAAEPHLLDSRRWQGADIWPIILAAVVGMALSASAWLAVSDQKTKQAELDFNSRASNHALALQTGIATYADDIEALRALFESSDHGVSRSEFEHFAARILQGQSAILSISWIPRIKHDERAAHEAAAVRDGIASYSIKNVPSTGGHIVSPDREEYFPVYYRLEKERLGKPYVYGVDQNEDGVRGKTLERARDSNQLKVSGDLNLRSGGGRGFLALMPVYRKGAPHDTIEQRRDNLIGFIRGAFETSVMIETILATNITPGGLDLYFFTSDSGRDPQLLHFHPSRLHASSVTPASYAALTAGLHWSGEIRIGDRKLTVVASPIPGGPGNASRIEAWMVLAAGLLITAVVTAHFWLSGRHSRRLQSANAALDKTLEALSNSSNELLMQNVRFDAALNNMLQGLVMYDSSARVVVCNNRYREIYGLSSEIAKPGCTLRELLQHLAERGNAHGNLDQYHAKVLAEVAAGTHSQLIKVNAAGRQILVSKVPMAAGGWVVTHEDITERRQAEDKIAHMSMHDALTDLPNRLFFRQAMENRLAHLDRDQKFSVLCLDLDHFKAVNDTLGHPFGDKLLRQVGERLRTCLREEDTVARLGGDEFAILQGNIDQPTDATSLMTRIIEAIGEPFDLDGHQVVVGVSVGAAVAPIDGIDPDQLLKNADMALYRAKVDGRGVYRFFESEMDARMQARRVLELDMRKALANGEFELYYQPLISLDTETISGFEALIRWNHPERGMVSPAEFIPLAEETALIVPIGEWVLRQACAEAANWPADTSVAVNLSPVQFKTPNLSQTIISALAQSGLPAQRLELEITESVLLFNNEATLATLHQLRALGVRISMDDFGTGYSSLSYLRSFPFDKIKIDQSFIHNLSSDEDAKAIIRAVAGLGTSLRMATTGEGVETQEELDYLKTMGCTQAQGYFFSKPRPAKDVRALLATQIKTKAVA